LDFACGCIQVTLVSALRGEISREIRAHGDMPNIGDASQRVAFGQFSSLHLNAAGEPQHLAFHGRTEFSHLNQKSHSLHRRLRPSVLLEAGAGIGMTLASAVGEITLTSAITSFAAESAFYMGVSQIAHPGGSFRNSQHGMFGNLQTLNPQANVPGNQSSGPVMTGGDFNQDSRGQNVTTMQPPGGDWDPRAQVSNTWFNNKVNPTGTAAGVTYGGRSGNGEHYGNHVNDADRSDGLSNIYNNKKLDSNQDGQAINDTKNSKESGLVFGNELITQ
jgi:hypothetical protein